MIELPGSYLQVLCRAGTRCSRGVGRGRSKESTPSILPGSEYFFREGGRRIPLLLLVCRAEGWCPPRSRWSISTTLLWPVGVWWGAASCKLARDWRARTRKRFSGGSSPSACIDYSHGDDGGSRLTHAVGDSYVAVRVSPHSHACLGSPSGLPSFGLLPLRVSSAKIFVAAGGPP